MNRGFETANARVRASRLANRRHSDDDLADFQWICPDCSPAARCSYIKLSFFICFITVCDAKY
jgi:hypothetical protein